MEREVYLVSNNPISKPILCDKNGAKKKFQRYPGDKGPRYCYYTFVRNVKSKLEVSFHMKGKNKKITKSRIDSKSDEPIIFDIEELQQRGQIHQDSKEKPEEKSSPKSKNQSKKIKPKNNSNNNNNQDPIKDDCLLIPESQYTFGGNSSCTFIALYASLWCLMNNGIHHLTPEIWRELIRRTCEISNQYDHTAFFEAMEITKLQDRLEHKDYDQKISSQQSFKDMMLHLKQFSSNTSSNHHSKDIHSNHDLSPVACVLIKQPETIAVVYTPSSSSSSSHSSSTGKNSHDQFTIFNSHSKPEINQPGAHVCRFNTAEKAAEFLIKSYPRVEIPGVDLQLNVFEYHILKRKTEQEHGTNSESLNFESPVDLDILFNQCSNDTIQHNNQFNSLNNSSNNININNNNNNNNININVNNLQDQKYRKPIEKNSNNNNKSINKSLPRKEKQRFISMSKNHRIRSEISFGSKIFHQSPIRFPYFLIELADHFFAQLPRHFSNVPLLGSNNHQACQTGITDHLSLHRMELSSLITILQEPDDCFPSLSSLRNQSSSSSSAFSSMISPLIHFVEENPIPSQKERFIMRVCDGDRVSNTIQEKSQRQGFIYAIAFHSEWAQMFVMLESRQLLLRYGVSGEESFVERFNDWNSLLENLKEATKVNSNESWLILQRKTKSPLQSSNLKHSEVLNRMNSLKI